MIFKLLRLFKYIRSVLKLSSSSDVVQLSALKVKALEVGIDVCRRCLNFGNAFFEGGMHLVPQN